MDYRIEELARVSGLGVDTIRFYQSKGLLPKPLRRGRRAVYDESHVDRLKLIRRMSKQGFSLALIKRTLKLENDRCRLNTKNTSDLKLLSALVDEGVGTRTFSRSEIAEETGIPESLISLALSFGLFTPTQIDGEEQYSQADVQMLKSGFSILEAGFSLEALLEIGKQHAENIEQTADKAIDLFDYYLRKGGAEGKKVDDTAQIFRKLLPHITRLVALHFQRTLINRALLKASGKRKSNELLNQFVTELQSAQLEVKWQA